MVISRIGALFFLISAAALLPFSARALVNAGALPIHVYDIEIVDGLAYVVGYSHPDGPPTLRILDLSDPAAPVEIGSLYTGTGSKDVEVVGGLAYITGWTDLGSNGVRIIDVSDPTLPVEVGAFPAQCYAADVEAVGNYAYLADQRTNSWIPECDWSIESKLRVIDVSNPAAPIQVSERGLEWPVDIEAAEGVVYAAGRDPRRANLESIDVSDPTAPVTVGVLPGAWGWDIDVADGYVYAAGGGYDPSTGELWGLEVFDVIDPTNPLSVGRSAARGRSIDVVDGVAYLGDYSGLRVVDVYDPAAPTPRGSLYAASARNALGVYGGYAYLATSEGLTIADLSLLDTPTEVGWAEVVGPAGDVGVPNDVEVADGVAYLAVGDDYLPEKDGRGLRTYDITDPTAPAPLGGIDTADFALDVELAAELAFVAAGTDGLRVFDVANPSAPVAAGALALPGSTAKLEVVGTTAYVVDRGITRETFRALRVVDVSNAAAPAQLGAVEFTDTNRPYACEIAGIAVVRELAYVTCDGLYVVDVSDPAQPALVFADRYPLSPRRSSVEVVGDRMYIGDGVGSFYVYDISDPTQPVVISEVPGGGRAMVVEDGFAYSAAGGGLAVHDLAGPLPAVSLGGYASVSGWNGLAIADGLIFGGTRSGGLQVVDLGPEYTRVRSVEIAIRAEGESAVVNLASRGVIAVAILGAADFDVALIDRSTLRFGPSSAAPTHKVLGHLKDVNGDARPDLISHYRIADTGFSEADEEACVSGQTSDGTPIRGCGTLGAMLPRGQSNVPSVADRGSIPRNPGARAARPL